jgi:peptidoglycan hydrolase CwlO-like protein
MHQRFKQAVSALIITLVVSASVSVLGPACAAAVGNSKILQEIKSEGKQIDEIQRQVKANKEALESLTRKVDRLSTTLGVGRISFGRTTYELIVGAFQCASDPNSCQT